MLRIAKTCFTLVIGAALLAGPVAAQERGEEIVGSIASVDGRSLTVSRENGADVHVQVTSGTTVEFTDSGDRKLFPNPGIDDLRAGMGVRFVYGNGTLDKISVHYVPAGRTVSKPSGPVVTNTAPEQLKVRILSTSRDGREMTADVAGRTQTFRVDGRDALRYSKGDLVVVTVEDRGGYRVVTRIQSADLFGRVTRLNDRSRTVTIDVNGREETYRVDDKDVLKDVSEGDSVRFEVEERGTTKVVTAMRRERSRNY
jgi:hypothetical protein